MQRPTRDSIEGLRPISRNLSLDLIAAIGLGVSGALVTSLLPTIARRGGLPPLGLAVLAAAPYLTNLLSVFSGTVGPRSTRQFALLRVVGAGSLAVLLLQSQAAVIIAVALVFWISVSFSAPFQLRLWGATYPARMRGRVVGFLGTGRAAAAAGAALIGGFLADQLGGPSAVALAGIVGAVCAVAYAGFRASRAAAPVGYSARESLRAMRERPTLQRVALAQGFFGGGFIAAGPLFALVNVDRLNLSLSDVGIIGVLSAVATTVSFLVWGAVADRTDALAPMRFGSIIGLGGLLAYAVAPGVAVLWLASIAIGVSNSSIDLGVAGVISAETPLASRAAAMSGWNAVTGARGLVAPFVMSALVQVGFIGVTTALLLCAAASGLGVVLFWWAARRARTDIGMQTASEPAT
ncbi:MAG: transporter, family, inner rane transport protein [Chloroflexota bacterium]|nr:transporter, family, inner rane transport protein [Chloroflexota bacterium]